MRHRAPSSFTAITDHQSEDYTRSEPAGLITDYPVATVSFAEVVREALEEKAVEGLPSPTCLGLFESGDPDGSSIADAGRIPPRS